MFTARAENQIPQLCEHVHNCFDQLEAGRAKALSSGRAPHVSPGSG